MKKRNIYVITEEDLGRIREIFSFYPCKLNCNDECLKGFISLYPKDSGFGILRPLIIERNCKSETLLLEILKEPFLVHKEIISEIENSFPSKFHSSTLIYKISEVQKIVMENPSEFNNIRDIASEVFLNPSYLSFKFKEITGISLKEFVRKIKLCNSLWEIISTEEPIRLIARKYGYAHEAFTRIFSSVFGLSPNSVRKNFHELLKENQEI